MTLVILSLLSALAHPFPHHEPDVVRSRLAVAGWRIDLRQDRFVGRTTCVVTRGRMRVERAVMLFRFPTSTDTANAQFRIDAGAAQSVGDVAVEVAGRGIALESGDLRHPSGGQVAVPLRLLSAAQSITIRPNARAGLRTFALSGLPSALQAAQTRGCEELATASAG